MEGIRKKGSTVYKEQSLSWETPGTELYDFDKCQSKLCVCACANSVSCRLSERTEVFISSG